MRRVLSVLLWVVVIAVMAIIGARNAFPLPDISNRPMEAAMPMDPATVLGKWHEQAELQNPGKSGVLPLQSGHDAFGSRIALARVAQRSIDAQYYIWHDDTAGILLFSELLDAARRGVQVRLLLDDNGVPGLDATMAALNAQDNFEIRLFNPSTVRKPKIMGYAFDFSRMNRRMHNKSFIVDGAAAIIGGRNIGNEYFQVGDDQFYVDMDVLGTGAVVPQTTDVFTAYWNSASVFDVASIIDGSGDIAAFEARATEARNSKDAATLRDDIEQSAQRFIDGKAPLEWTDVQVIADDPAKGQGIATADQLMISQLGQILGGVKKRLDLVSAYFVPGRQGTDFFDNLAKSGVDVRILTNALNTTDVLPVHAGYARYRKELMEAGVKLYELKLRGDMTPESDIQLKPLGLSGASLHAKTFAVDGSRVFIGSFNFDPRSALLNCEMGFLIDSPTMARNVTAGFDGPIDGVSYRPELDAAGDMIWLETQPDGTVVTHGDEPGASLMDRIGIAIISRLPVEWLL